MKTWILYGLLSMLLMGVGNFLLKLAGNAGLPMSGVLGIVFLTQALFGLGMLFILKPDLTSAGSGPFIAIAGGLLLGTALTFLVLAFDQPDAKTGITVALLNTNFALVTVLGAVFLQEALTIKQLAGLGVILAGIFLLI